MGTQFALTFNFAFLLLQKYIMNLRVLATHFDLNNVPNFKDSFLVDLVFFDIILHKLYLQVFLSNPMCRNLTDHVSCFKSKCLDHHLPVRHDSWECFILTQDLQCFKEETSSKILKGSLTNMDYEICWFHASSCIVQLVLLNKILYYLERERYKVGRCCLEFGVGALVGEAQVVSLGDPTYCALHWFMYIKVQSRGCSRPVSVACVSLQGHNPKLS